MISPAVAAALHAAQGARPSGNIADMVTGGLSSPVAGRTDHLPISVPANAFVIPADVVSALGEGNTNNGLMVLGRVLGRMATQAGGHLPGDKVDIMAAGGEFVVPPQAVAALGHGNMRQGHAVLVSFVKRVRKQNIETLRRMPGPKKMIMTEPSAVRIAQPEDLDGLMALARLMHREVGLLPLDEAKTRTAIGNAVGLGLVGVIGHPVPLACLCLEIGSPYYSRARQLVEFMNFVHPEHRRTSNAKDLIAWAKFVSDSLAIPLLAGVFGVKRTAAKVRLFERQLEHVGATFMHNRHLAQAGPLNEVETR